MGSLESGFGINSIGIVGAGPAGITAAKYLLAEKHFDRIVIFEQRNNVGGIWNYTPDDDLTKAEAQAQSFPRTSSHAPLEKPIWRPKDEGSLSQDVGQKEAAFVSALYDDLESNIPKELMQFSDYPFNKELQLFPGRKEVLEYLEEHAREVGHLIRFQTQVSDVRQSVKEAWVVQSRDLESGDEREEQFDAIVVASGHFDVPYIPDIQGVKEWNERSPGTLNHSKFYRRPDDYRGKKVVIVGNSASGLDIGSQIATVCKLPLLVSQRSESYLSPGGTPDKAERPEIIQFDVNTRTVTFAEGQQEADIDAVLFCTGYFYRLPFLSSLKPPLINDGSRVQNLYQHVFWRPNPTLAFLALNQKVTPFPIAQAQAAVVSRVWSDRLDLPSEHEMEEWEAAIVREQGWGKAFHVLQYPKDARYLNMLHDWAETARSRKGLERQGKGRDSPSWDERLCWLRERFPAIRKAFRAVGESRDHLKSVEEVGFDFESSHIEKRGAPVPSPKDLSSSKRQRNV